jgi:unsaturated chondroitin disaccharide hydrolase
VSRSAPTAGSGHETQSAALAAIFERVNVTLDAYAPRFPLYVENDGRWYTTEDGNWCAGHWIGLLWLAAKRSTTAEAGRRFASTARTCIEALLAQPLTHLFAGMNHYYAGFLGFDVDGDNELRALGLRGADAMLRLYDPVARQIPIGRYSVAPPDDNVSGRTSDWDRWDLEHMAAVDAIHTSVPILWRAYIETGERSYYDVAAAHTMRHIEWHMRADGSTTQLRRYDPRTGVPGAPFSTLANDEGGCWARGLAWSIAGLADAYVATGDANVLEAIRRSMSYYKANTSSDLIPTWDLTCRSAGTAYDSSAAAIVAYGLLRLGRRRDEATVGLESDGTRILSTLLADCLVSDEQAANHGAVLHGCYRHPQQVAIDTELIWTDFYTAAALDLITPV